MQKFNHETVQQFLLLVLAPTPHKDHSPHLIRQDELEIVKVTAPPPPPPKANAGTGSAVAASPAAKAVIVQPPPPPPKV